MEIDIIKRETTGMGPNVYHENDTIAKYEIMDGAPVRGEPLSVSFFLFSSQLVAKWVSEINTVCVGTLGESIPIRLFLAGYEMTPTMRDINKKFSVRYYLNLVLIDEEERRYFKQQVGRLKATCVSPKKQQRELIKEQTRQPKSELVACRSLKNASPLWCNVTELLTPSVKFTWKFNVQTFLWVCVEPRLPWEYFAHWNSFFPLQQLIGGAVFFIPIVQVALFFFQNPQSFSSRYHLYQWWRCGVKLGQVGYAIY